MSLPPEKASELKQIIQDHLIKVCLWLYCCWPLSKIYNNFLIIIILVVDAFASCFVLFKAEWA